MTEKERIEKLEADLHGNHRKGVLDRLIRLETKMYFIYAGLIIIILMLSKLLMK